MLKTKNSETHDVQKEQPDSEKTNAFDSKITQVNSLIADLTPIQREEAILTLVKEWTKEQKWDLVCKLENELKANPFDHLPHELLIHLLSFLSQKDLARAAQV
jgi:hypothetical protein